MGCVITEVLGVGFAVVGTAVGDAVVVAEVVGLLLGVGVAELGNAEGLAVTLGAGGVLASVGLGSVTVGLTLGAGEDDATVGPAKGPWGVVALLVQPAAKVARATTLATLIFLGESVIVPSPPSIRLKGTL
ncbi:MAG TPA: hypothetical protein VHD60_02550 [Candidatus Saccharimonadales bacterium]|nr:hypothetical protein [Candidatus Saccharimonadales bacterium]